MQRYFSIDIEKVKKFPMNACILGNLCYFNSCIVFSEIPSLPRCSTASPTGSVLTYGSHLTIPRPNGVPDPAIHTRTASESSMKPGPSISGIFFAIKHWISKHFYVCVFNGIVCAANVFGLNHPLSLSLSACSTLKKTLSWHQSLSYFLSMPTSLPS